MTMIDGHRQGGAAERRRVRELLYRVSSSDLEAVADRILRTFDDAQMVQVCSVDRLRPARGRRAEAESSQLPIVLQTHLRLFVRIAKLASRYASNPTEQAGKLLRRWGAWSGVPHRTTLSRSYRMPQELIDRTILENLRNVGIAAIPIRMEHMIITPVRRGPNGERLLGDGVRVPVEPQWAKFSGQVPTDQR